ncbi:MAG: type II toxin-antitoxin system VapC family toxin [Pseudomonadota bacterium]
MSAFLADTHIPLWNWSTPQRIPKRFLEILDSGVTVWVSHVTLWEIAIKDTRLPVKVPRDMVGALEAEGFQLLPIELEDVLGVRSLPRHHGDPFDRLLIVQAQRRNLTLMSADREFRSYDVALA